LWDLENKEEKTEQPRKMKTMMKGFFKEGMKDDVMKRLKRSIIVLLLVLIGYIVFISLHSFVWSTNFTFYQNLVITFDALLIAMVIGLVLIYKISGLGEMIKKFKGMTDKFTKDED
jgi:hypothetical protein